MKSIIFRTKVSYFVIVFIILFFSSNSDAGLIGDLREENLLYVQFARHIEGKILTNFELNQLKEDYNKMKYYTLFSDNTNVNGIRQTAKSINKITSREQFKKILDESNFDCEYTDNYKFLGQLSDGKYNGIGSVFFNNGNFYIGNFENGKFQGFGVYYWKNGDRYVGNWYDDKRDGYGTKFNQDGKKYLQKWEKDELIGNSIENKQIAKNFFMDYSGFIASWAHPTSKHLSTEYWSNDDAIFLKFEFQSRVNNGIYYTTIKFPIDSKGNLDELDVIDDGAKLSSAFVAVTVGKKILKDLLKDIFKSDDEKTEKTTMQYLNELNKEENAKNVLIGILSLDWTLNGYKDEHLLEQKISFE